MWAQGGPLLPEVVREDVSASSEYTDVYRKSYAIGEHPFGKVPSVNPSSVRCRLSPCTTSTLVAEPSQRRAGREAAPWRSDPRTFGDPGTQLAPMHRLTVRHRQQVRTATPRRSSSGPPILPRTLPGSRQVRILTGVAVGQVQMAGMMSLGEAAAGGTGVRQTGTTKKVMGILLNAVKMTTSPLGTARRYP